MFVGAPDQTGREQILRIQLRKMSVDTDVDIEDIAIAVRCSTRHRLVPRADCLFHRRRDVLVQKSLRCAKKLP